jgi:putative glycosyltransferase (TIGR04372 family)
VRVIGMLKRALLAVAGVAAFAATLHHVVRAWRRAIREQRASRTVLLLNGGFGHTVTSPDLLRRALGADCGVVILGPAWRYNPRVGELFADVRVTVAEIPTEVSLFGWPVSVATGALIERILMPALEFRLGRLGAKTVLKPVSFSAFVEMRRDRSLPVYTPPREAADPGYMANVRDYLTYLTFARHPGPAPARLPEATLVRCRAALDAVLVPGRKIAALYTRQRESQSGDLAVLTRNGAPPEDYGAAIEWLIERGYNVLAAGDLEFPPALAARHKRHFSDGRGLEIDRNLFMLYAASACDVWIGEAGGGATIPFVARRPMLGINWFPYSICYPGMTLCYKTLHPKGDGAICGFAEAFGAGAFRYEHPNRDLRTVPPEILRAAIADFVDAVETDRAPGAPPSALGPIHPDIALNHVEAFVSRPWLEFCAARQPRE